MHILRNAVMTLSGRIRYVLTSETLEHIANRICIDKGRHQFLMHTMNVTCLAEYGAQLSQSILGIAAFAPQPHTLP